ncbi:ABC transporter substrate-binding protein [Mesobacillus maritimus]|uniref:ABC transporter substrate-binding protein n=2 Tax=Mesobacillus maritimus TaxID=1643336 RepID=A0ABS7K4Z9_9BACI|nr:ABC transporter substrate-binding protein [Mesobacillus maritimus]
MKKWMKPGLALLLSFVLIIPLAACGQEKKEKIRIAEVTRSIFYAPLYAALDQGFFEDEGLDIELTTVWGGDKVMTSLLSDGADIGLVGSETSIYVYARGASDPVINFGQLTQTDGTFLVSRNEIEDFSWDQLKDSTFLGQRKGGMPQMVGEFVLKKHGIDPQNDLNLIQNIDFANISSAFAGGTGEFVQLFEPQASIFEKEGRGHIVASFGTESGHVPYTTFMAKQSFMEENDETVEKFTRALYKAQQWVADTDAKKIAEAIQPYFEDTDLEILEMAVDRYKSQGSFATDPILDEEEWNNLQNIMEEAGELPTEVLHEELVNTTIAEKVMN